MSYKHFPNRPETLTPEFVESTYAHLLAQTESAEQSEAPDQWLAVMRAWNEFSSYMGGEGSRRNHRLNRDMRNEEAEEAMNFYRRTISPVSEAGEGRMIKALLGSRHLGAITETFGEYLIERRRLAQDSLAPVNSDLRVKNRDLANRYSKLIASAEVEVDGEMMSMAAAGSLMRTEDEGRRKEIWTIVREWFSAKRDELAAIYGEMVEVRHAMATNLGYDNYIPLGYMEMIRTDYGPTEAADFRKSVREHLVPLLAAIHKSDGAEHGTEWSRPWNTSYVPSRTIPRGIVPVDTQLDTAEKLFDEIAPTLADHFRRMRQEDLIDLENRKGKRSGAYCTTFSDEGRVAILCNSVGDSGDVRTLIHEMGHAFQAWESQAIEMVPLQRPTSDAAEVHSMGLEHLALKKIDLFFNEEHAARFRRIRLIHSLSIMVYVCVVDEFQHRVYENPNATAEEREGFWAEIAGTYMPGQDYSGYEEYLRQGWHRQGHIFWRPFYYIDYGIAETGAIQLGMLDREDPEKALSTYIDLCRLGGQKSVTNIFASAGLRSPFSDPDLIADIASYLSTELELEPLEEMLTP